MTDTFTDNMKKLQTANVPKDKKALYSLVRWAYLHPTASYQEITSRINMTYLSQRGYMKKYNTDAKRAYNAPKMRARYQTDKTYRERNLFHTRSSHIPNKHYMAEDLVKQDLIKIDNSIKKLAKDMKQEWTAPRRVFK